MEPATGLLIVVVVLLVVLLYKVNRLERMLPGGPPRKKPLRRSGKVVPILKEHIEPGPFKPESRDDR